MLTTKSSENNNYNYWRITRQKDIRCDGKIIKCEGTGQLKCRALECAQNLLSTSYKIYLL